MPKNLLYIVEYFDLDAFRNHNKFKFLNLNRTFKRSHKALKKRSCNVIPSEMCLRLKIVAEKNNLVCVEESTLAITFVLRNMNYCLSLCEYSLMCGYECRHHIMSVVGPLGILLEFQIYRCREVQEGEYQIQTKTSYVATV